MLEVLPDNLLFLVINFVAMSTIGRGRMACKLWLKHYADAFAKHVKQDLQALVAIVTESLRPFTVFSQADWYQWLLFEIKSPLPAFAQRREISTRDREVMEALRDSALVALTRLRETLAFYERTALPLRFGESRPATWPDEAQMDNLFTLCCRCRCRALVELLLPFTENRFPLAAFHTIASLFRGNLGTAATYLGKGMWIDEHMEGAISPVMLVEREGLEKQSAELLGLLLEEGFSSHNVIITQLSGYHRSGFDRIMAAKRISALLNLLIKHPQSKYYQKSMKNVLAQLIYRLRVD